MGTPVHRDHTVWLRHHENEWPGTGGFGECAWLHRYNVIELSG
jgi:hypothetical protein